jgi:hypothetical protein
MEDEHGNKISNDAIIADKIQDNQRVFLKFEEIKVEEEKVNKVTGFTASAKKK